MTEIEKNLTEQINAEHRAVEDAARSAVEHAMNAGDMLAEKKASLQHGEWGAWLAQHFEGSQNTAGVYMKLARNREALGNSQHARNLSIRGALAELDSPDEESSLPYARTAQHTYYTIEEYARARGYRVSPPLLIDPEYHEILPPHQPDEYAGLERSILREGCRDAIAACNSTILDGHARYEICTKHGIKFLVRDVEKSNRHECLMYIIDAQMGRVNLSYLEKAYARGKQEVSRIASEQGISEDQAFDEYMNETAPA